MDKLVIGNIIKPQGIKGEVKVKPYTDTPADIGKFKNVYIGGEEHRILSFRTDGVFVYLALKGVADRNAAELLRDKDILAARDEAPDLDEGKFYIVDIIGCSVFYENGEKIGVISDVTPAATDVYTLSSDGKRDVMFPAVKGVILSVDVAAKRITVDKKRFSEVSVAQ